MKSKTSFFNKAVFWKNLTLYWPIWVCYLLYGLIKGPCMMWFRLQNYRGAEGAAYMALADSLNLKLDIVVIAVVAVICGMSLFGYLFSARSAYMIHALPVMRKELFCTNVASGLSFLFVPQLLVFISTVLLCLANEIACVQYVGIWLLSVMGISLILFSIVCFCAMLTGLVFALPVFFGVMNYLTLGLSVGVRLIFSLNGYGINYNDTPDILFLRVLSPIDYLMDGVSLTSISYYDSKGALASAGISYSGGGIVLGYALAALLVYAVSYYCYRLRRSESAGDLLAFSWLKPVFRWGVGICSGYFVGILVKSMVTGFSMWAALVVFGLIAYFVADMFVQKSFRVFTRAGFRESVLFLGFVVISYGGMYAATYGVEHYVPDESKLEKAYLYMNYPVEFEGGQMSEVCQIQREIIEQGRQLQEEAEEDGDAITVSFIYHLKNGGKLERLYKLPADEDFSVDLAAELYQYELEPDSFMKYLVGSDYDEITRFEETEVEYDSEDGSYISQTLDSSAAAKIYRAVCEDVKAGTLQKYNLQDYQNEDAYTYMQETGVYLYFKFYHTTEAWEDAFDRANGSLLSHNAAGYVGYEEDNKTGYLNLSLGEDCTNVIDALCEAGVIDSVDDLLFSDPEE
jgi:ABC-2 type transport system permease protein